MKQRDVSIDIAKGVAILSVIIGHCVLTNNIVAHVIYSFHMPLFFLFAGYFYRQKPIAGSFRNDFSRLIVPFLVFAFVGASKFTITRYLEGAYDSIPLIWLGALWGSGGDHHEALLFSQINDVGVIWVFTSIVLV